MESLMLNILHDAPPSCTSRPFIDIRTSFHERHGQRARWRRGLSLIHQATTPIRERRGRDAIGLSEIPLCQAAALEVANKLSPPIDANGNAGHAEDLRGVGGPSLDGVHRTDTGTHGTLAHRVGGGALHTGGKMRDGRKTPRRTSSTATWKSPLDRRPSNVLPMTSLVK